MKHTLATKRRLSIMRRGKGNPFYGKKHSPETRAKLAVMLRSYSKRRTYELSAISITIPTGCELAYLGGLVDGEGSFAFRGIRPFIAIYNTDEGLMRWLLYSVGGSVNRGDHRGRKVCRAWSISAARDVYALSVALSPVLRVKRKACVGVIHFLEKKYGKRL